MKESNKTFWMIKGVKKKERKTLNEPEIKKRKENI